MILNKAGKLITELDFRGTKVEFLDELSAKDLFLVIASVQRTVNKKETFKALDLTPKEWNKTEYEPIFIACKKDKDHSKRLFGVIVKQALIMSPLLFLQEQEDETNLFDAAKYTRV